MENISSPKLLLQYVYSGQINFGVGEVDDANRIEVYFSMVTFALRYELEDVLNYVLRNLLINLVKVETVAQITNRLLAISQSQSAKQI